MNLDRSPLILLSTSIYTVIFSYTLQKSGNLVSKIISNKENRIKNIILSLAIFSSYPLLFLSHEYLRSFNIESSFIYGMYLGLAIFPWILLKKNIEKKKSYGENIFQANRLSNAFDSYLTITATIVLLDILF